MAAANPRVALVTGCSSGFGKLIAEEFAAAGIRVYATMRDPKKSPFAPGDEDPISVLPLDVTAPDTIQSALKTIEEREERLHIVVNNAGFGLGGFFEDVTDTELRHQFDTNFFGALSVTREALPLLRQTGDGYVVNISSINGRVAMPGVSSYGASKWALEGHTEALRHELRPFGIRVVLVQPGTFRTEIFERNRQVAQGAQDKASPYHAMTQRLLRIVDKRIENATEDPRKVAHRVTKIVHTKRPKLRYVVGREARAIAWLRKLLSDHTMEKIVRKGAGLS